MFESSWRGVEGRGGFERWFGSCEIDIRSHSQLIGYRCFRALISDPVDERHNVHEPRPAQKAGQRRTDERCECTCDVA